MQRLLYPHETRIYLINNQPIKTECHLLTYTLTFNVKVLQYSRENDIEDLTPQTISTFILFSFSLGMVHLLHHWHQFHLIWPWPISGPLEGHLKTKLWQPSRIFSLLQKIIISIWLDWQPTLVLIGLKLQSNFCIIINRKMIQVFLTHSNIFFYILILHLSDCIEYTILPAYQICPYILSYTVKCLLLPAWSSTLLQLLVTAFLACDSLSPNNSPLTSVREHNAINALTFYTLFSFRFHLIVLY